MTKLDAFEQIVFALHQARHALLDRNKTCDGLRLVLHPRDAMAIKRDAPRPLFDLCGADREGVAILMGAVLEERNGQAIGRATLMQGKTPRCVIEIEAGA